MSYPGLSIEAASEIDKSRRADINLNQDIGALAIWKPGAHFDKAIAKDCLNQCCDLVEMMRDTSASPAEFDSKCAPLVHGALALSPQVAGDGDFWRWLTFMDHCYGAEIVDWRYGRRRKGQASSGVARQVYYGLGHMKKGMFAKLWICADMMYVENQKTPYDGIEYADVDLWDSHVIDVDYGSVPAVARAFVKIVRDLRLPRGGPSTPNESAGYRDLAKEIRRRHATLAIELFSDDIAYLWIKEVWGERDSWCRR